MKASICIIGTLAVIAFSSAAQEKKQTRTKKIKLYSTINFNDREQSTTNSSTGRTTTENDKNFDWSKVTPAFQWQSGNGTFQELELTDCIIRKKSSSSIVIIDNVTGISQLQYGINAATSAIGFRYEYGYSFLKKQDKRFNLSMGAAVSPYVMTFDMEPRIASQSEKTTSAQAAFQLIPGVSYKFRKFVVDINSPFTVLDLFQGKTTYTNNISSDETITKANHTDFFPKNYSIRIGLAYKICQES